MLKFLRRYNKMILVVGGVVLMVVFLLPQAISQFGPNRNNVVLFRADGKAFRGKQVNEAGQELQNLQTIQQIAYQQSGIAANVYPRGIESVTHWLLIVREAEDLGLVGGPDGGLAFLDELADQTAQQMLFQQQGASADQKQQIKDLILEGLRAGRARVIDGGTPDVVIDKTLARVRAIYRLIGLAQGLPSLSTREAAYFGREFLDTAIANIVLVGASAYESQVPAPGEQELMAQFEKYKAVDPKDDEYRMGYLRPPAVRVEALQIDRTVIRNAIKLDPIDVNKFWRQNQDQYGSDFQAARLKVETALRTSEVQSVMGKVEELIRRELFKATKDLKTLEGGYRELPADWASKRPNYGVLAEQINALVGGLLDLGDAQPASALPADAWLSMANLINHPASTASATVAGQSLRFPQLALSVRQLDPTSRTGVQTGLTFGPVDVKDYKLFYFRDLDARPATPPDSLDEVRDKVRDDYVRLQAYARLLADKDSVRDQIVSTGGFHELYDRFSTGMTVREDMRVTTDNVAPPENVSPLPAANNPELRDAVTTLIEGWDPKQIATQIPLEDRVLITPLPESTSVAFTIVKGHHPMTVEELRQNDFRVLRTAQTQWTDPDAANPFSFDALKVRLKYVPAKGQGSDEDEEDQQEPDPNALRPG